MEDGDAANDLAVVLLDTVAGVDVEGSAAAHAALAAESARSLVALVAADADKEEKSRNEQSRPGAPAEAESVGTNFGIAACASECVTGLNEGGTAERKLA